MRPAHAILGLIILAVPPCVAARVMALDHPVYLPVLSNPDPTLEATAIEDLAETETPFPFPGQTETPVEDFRTETPTPRPTSPGVVATPVP